MSLESFWGSIFLNIGIILTTFYLSSIGFLWYIEKNISIPIESISKITKNFISSDDKIKDASSISSKVQKYANDQTEIGILAGSFKKMINDLEGYMKNLEEITAEKERINTELNIAEKIQNSMLPKIFPPFPDRKEFDIYAVSNPAKEVGGDFYDFFLVDDDHIAIIIADVSGKGIPSALFMVVAKTLIKNQTLLGMTPSEVFTTVNNQLCDGNDQCMFVTAWMGILEISTGKLTFANAGHNLPLLKHESSEYNSLMSKPGLVLGGMDNIAYTQNEIFLNHGDRIYLYTDGVTEAINSNDEFFTEDRLIKVINNTNNKSIKNVLVDIEKEINVFTNGVDQFDDITMLILEYRFKLLKKV
jgi:serine phosphatase RsbU (regulator of sigma subunit)/HAMP domain-containing protein